jgi:hypothetical protein
MLKTAGAMLNDESVSSPAEASGLTKDCGRVFYREQPWLFNVL